MDRISHPPSFRRPLLGVNRLNTETLGMVSRRGGVPSRPLAPIPRSAGGAAAADAGERVACLGASRRPDRTADAQVLARMGAGRDTRAVRRVPHARGLAEIARLIACRRRGADPRHRAGYSVARGDARTRPSGRQGGGQPGGGGADNARGPVEGPRFMAVRRMRGQREPAQSGSSSDHRADGGPQAGGAGQHVLAQDRVVGGAPTAA